MIFFLVITAASFAVMAVIVFKNLPKVRTLPQEVISQELSKTPSIHSDILFHIFVPAYKVMHNYLVPKVLDVSEKTVMRFRVMILKLERKLQRVNNYLAGKRTLNGNGKTSDYWTSISEHQNCIKNSIEKEN